MYLSSLQCNRTETKLSRVSNLFASFLLNFGSKIKCLSTWLIISVNISKLFPSTWQLNRFKKKQAELIPDHPLCSFFQLDSVSWRTCNYSITTFVSKLCQRVSNSKLGRINGTVPSSLAKPILKHLWPPSSAIRKPDHIDHSIFKHLDLSPLRLWVCCNFSKILDESSKELNQTE